MKRLLPPELRVFALAASSARAPVCTSEPSFPFASAAALANSPRSRADIRGAATLLIVR